MAPERGLPTIKLWISEELAGDVQKVWEMSLQAGDAKEGSKARCGSPSSRDSVDFLC